MKRVFAFLTDYLIKKGLVQEEDRPIYEYGFQILIEIFLWVLCCTIIAALTCSLIELCIFFIIFFNINCVPVKSAITPSFIGLTALMLSGVLP